MLNQVYYCDYRNNRRQRFRVEVFGPDNSTLTRTLPPAWGEDPAPGSNYVRIPRRALKAITDGGEAGFEAEIPVGLAMTTTYKLTWDMGRLVGGTDSDADGTTDLEDLRDYINQFTAAAGGSLTVAGGTVTIPTTTGYRIMTDNGNAALAVASFALRFEGVQRVLPTRQGKILPKLTHTKDVELFDIARAALERVSMAWVCAHVRATYTPRGDKWFDRAWNLFWVGPDGERYATGIAFGKMKFWRFTELYLAMQSIVNQAVAKMAREPVGAAHFRLRGPWEDATYYGAMPDDHWEYFKRDHSTTATSSNDPAGTKLARNERYFCGLVAPYSDSTIEAAGVLIDGDDSLHRYNNCWDYLVAICEPSVCKAFIEHPGAAQAELWFMPPFAKRARFTGTLASILTDAGATGQPEIDVEEGHGLIRRVEIVLSAALPGDVERYEGGDGTAGDGKFDAETVFDNTSLLADDARWQRFSGSPDMADPFTCAAMIDDTLAVWKMYYFEEPPMALEEVAVLVHDTCAIDSFNNGSGAYPYNQYPTIDLPKPSEGDVGGLGDWVDYDQFADVFLKPMQQMIVLRQLEMGVAAAAGKELLERFDETNNPVSYVFMMRSEDLNLEHLGWEYVFGTPDLLGVLYSACNFLATGDTYLRYLPGHCWPVRITVDDETGITEVTMFGHY
jgi:hypothetical protein